MRFYSWCFSIGCLYHGVSRFILNEQNVREKPSQPTYRKNTLYELLMLSLWRQTTTRGRKGKNDREVSTLKNNPVRSISILILCTRWYKLLPAIFYVASQSICNELKNTVVLLLSHSSVGNMMTHSGQYISKTKDNI